MASGAGKDTGPRMAIQTQLVTQPDAGELDFVANSAVDQVLINSPALMEVFFQNPNGASSFAPNENLILQRLNVNIPFGFGQGAGNHIVQIRYRQNAVLFEIPEFNPISPAGISNLFIPDLCEGIIFPDGGLLLNPRLAGLDQVNRYDLVLTSAVLNVSQISLPAALDTDTIVVAYHLQIKNTLPLQ